MATREVELSIDGMSCAACAVRIEKKLNKIGDVSAAVNYATATARVTVPSSMPAQTLTTVIEDAGYCAQDRTALAGDGDYAAAGRDAAYLRRRLILALVFFVPLTDLSLLLSLVPSDRFPGWQWALVACAAPVALWAQAEKAAIQRLADRICGVFVPLVLTFSVLTLAGWLLAGSPAGHAFSAGLAVLIIACPCALGLATPAALVAASGRGAQLGIFIKRYQALEFSQSVDTVVLDKTGTLTTGRMSLTAVHTLAGTGRADLLRHAGAVEQASEHAVAAAITSAATAETGPLPQAERFTALPGLGARGTVGGLEVVIGRAALFTGRGIEVPPDLARVCRAWEQAGHTTVLIGWDGTVRGAVAIADTVKPSASAAVAELRGLGLHPVLLTGDNEATARAVAAATGIDEVIAGTLPSGKADVIRDLQQRGRRVAMAGDGVNDAPALAAASLGLALGSGTDVAMSAADLILLRDDLGVVADAIRLARGTFRTIRRNLAWAFGYNLAALPLAALGFLNPIVASAAMTLSSVLVVWNSLRLGRFRVRGPVRHPPAPVLRPGPRAGQST